MSKPKLIPFTFNATQAYIIDGSLTGDGGSVLIRPAGGDIGGGSGNVGPEIPGAECTTIINQPADPAWLDSLGLSAEQWRSYDFNIETAERAHGRRIVHVDNRFAWGGPL